MLRSFVIPFRPYPRRHPQAPQTFPNPSPVHRRNRPCLNNSLTPCSATHPTLSIPLSLNNKLTLESVGCFNSQLQSSSCITNSHHAYRTKNCPCTSPLSGHLYVMNLDRYYFLRDFPSRRVGLLDRAYPDDVWIPNQAVQGARVWGMDCHFLNLEQFESTYFVILLDSVVIYASLICWTAYQSLVGYSQASSLVVQESSTGYIYLPHNYIFQRQFSF